MSACLWTSCEDDGKLLSVAHCQQWDTASMSDMSGHDRQDATTPHTLALTELEARAAAAGVLISSHRQLTRHHEAFRELTGHDHLDKN
jgi:hypothetical protein